MYHKVLTFLLVITALCCITAQKSSYCYINGTEYFISDENELTISWTLLELNCSEVQIDIHLFESTCTAEDCIEKIENISIRSKSYTFLKNLTACAKYIYKVFESFSHEIYQEEAIEAKVQYQRISVEISQSEGQITSLFIKWTYDKYPLCRTRFKIEVREDSLVKSFEVEVNSTIIEDLQPCANYNISVHPVGTSLEEFGDTKSYRLNTAIPSSIQDLNVVYNILDLSYDITWKPPRYYRKCVKNYSIDIVSSMEENQKIIVPYTNYKFTNLFACTYYSIKVIPLTLFKDLTGPPAVKEVQAPSKPFVKPSPPKIDEYTSSAVKLSAAFDAKAQRNNCNVSMAEFTCTNNDLSHNITKTVEERLNIELNGLEAYTTYKCYVRLKTKEEIFSDYSDEQIVKTYAEMSWF